MDFANPLFMAAGGALVSAPILIHLINRMRFKRIRWAAMEFLLKSQKRNRRKLIIEQLILLALRCLLVLLAGFLLGRLRLGGDTGQNAFHFVVLDDTPSMGDRFIGNNAATNSFEEGKDQVKQLARSLADARNGQVLRVSLLSDLNNSIFDKKIDDGTIGELEKQLEAPEMKPSALHVKPIEALKKAREVFEKERARDDAEHRPSGKKVLHFVSDFREGDWKGDADLLGKAIDSLGATGAYVSLIDVAHPFRDATASAVASHANLSIQELRPTSTIAIDGATAEFTVGVYNHSGEPRKTSFRVFSRSICVNDKGQLDDEQEFKPETDAAVEFTHTAEAGDQPPGAAPEDAQAQTDALPPHQLTYLKFRLVLKKKQKAQEIKRTDKPEEKERKRLADAEFVQVRVQIQDDPQDTGLAADNVRDAVVALERNVPVLVVDGDTTGASLKKNGDSWYLQAALDSALSYRMDVCTVADLDKIQLDRYPDVFLVNVPGLKNETIQKLADYVAKGGGLAYFLGDQSKAEEYNKIFTNKDDQDKAVYENATQEHLFPVLLELEPSKPMSEREIADRLVNDKQPKILFPDEDHPIIRGTTTGPADKGGLVKLESRLRFLTINRYWRCLPRSKWDAEPYQAQEAVVLPNRNPIDQYKRAAQEYIQRVPDLIAVPINEINKQLAVAKNDQERARLKQELQKAHEKWDPYLDRVAGLHEKMITALGRTYLDELIGVLDELMNDAGVKDDPKQPNMPGVVAQPHMRSLKDDIDGFRHDLKYGDPLVVTRSFGKGRVLAFLTTPGTSPRGTPAVSWNDWAGSPIAGSYAVFIKQLQDYLISTSEQRTLLVGTDVTLPQLEANLYQPEVRRFFLAQTPLGKGGADDKPSMEATTLTLQATGPDDARVYKDVQEGKQFNEPGVYVFEFTPDPRADTPVSTVLQAYAFNMDAEAEGELTRASRETLVSKSTTGPTLAAGGRVSLRAPGASFEEFKEPPPDLSTMVWLFLLIGVVFIAEQALAVRLSFHLKEGEAAAAPAAEATGGGVKYVALAV